MATYVDQLTAFRASRSGKLIGKTEPSRETKGSWWEVFVINSGKIIACVTTTTGVICGENLSESEIGSYVDDEVEARSILANFKNESDGI